MILTSSNFPFLQVEIKVLNRKIRVKTLIDTGFDGGVAIPPNLILNGKPPDGYSPWMLADGKVISVPYFYGKLKIGKFTLINTIVLALGDEPLIGRGITDRFKVTLDHGQKVIVEP